MASWLSFFNNDLHLLNKEHEGFRLDPDVFRGPDFTLLKFESNYWPLLKQDPKFMAAGIEGATTSQKKTIFLRLVESAKKYRERYTAPTQLQMNKLPAERRRNDEEKSNLRHQVSHLVAENIRLESKMASDDKLRQQEEHTRSLREKIADLENGSANVKRKLLEESANQLNQTSEGAEIVMDKMCASIHDHHLVDTTVDMSKTILAKVVPASITDCTTLVQNLATAFGDQSMEVSRIERVGEVDTPMMRDIDVGDGSGVDGDVDVDGGGGVDGDVDGNIGVGVGVGEDEDEVPSFQNERIVELTTHHEEAVKALTKENEKLTIQLAESHAKGEKKCPLILSLQQKVEELEQEKFASAIKLEQEKTASAIKLNTKEGTIATKASTIATKDIEINKLESDKIALDNTVVRLEQRNDNLGEQIRSKNETVTGLNNRIIQLKGNHHNQITQLKGDRRNEETLLRDVIDSVNKANTKLETAKRGYIRVEKDLRKKLRNWNWIIACIVVLSLLAYHLFFSNDTVSSSKQASVEYPYENKYSGEEE